MENATKALLMAGGVLISIIVFSIGLLLYSAYSKQAEMYNQTIVTAELQKFNSRFEVYLGREDITMQEIVTVVKLAEKYEGQGIIIDILIDGQKFDSSPEEFIKSILDDPEEVGDINFSCYCDESETNRKNPIYDEEGRITKLSFNRIRRTL